MIFKIFRKKPGESQGLNSEPSRTAWRDWKVMQSIGSGVKEIRIHVLADRCSLS